jgi:hypothetical protein
MSQPFIVETITRLLDLRPPPEGIRTERSGYFVGAEKLAIAYKHVSFCVFAISEYTGFCWAGAQNPVYLQ